MYNGVGLVTPRGSGSNGYTQSNKFLVKKKMLPLKSGKDLGFTKKPKNKDILDHDRKRQIELNLVILEDTLINHGYSRDEIDDKLNQARINFEATASASEITGRPTVGDTTAIMVADEKLF